MTHLAQRSGRLPESMILDNVKLYQKDNEAPRPIAGGSFADVYLGIHTTKEEGNDRKNVVAIKQLRLFGGVEDMHKRVRVRRSTFYSYIFCIDDFVHSKCTSRF